MSVDNSVFTLHSSNPDFGKPKIFFVYDAGVPTLSIAFGADSNDGGRVFGPGGLKDSLKGAIPEAKFDVARKCWRIPFTGPIRMELLSWLDGLDEHGFTLSEIMKGRNVLNALKAASTKIDIKFQETAVGPLPPERLLRLEGLDRLPPVSAYALLDKVPGIFFVSDKGSPVEARYSIHRTASQILPPVGYCSVVYVEHLKPFVSSSLVLDMARQKAGLDYINLGPDAFVVPGINADTGHPYTLRSYQAEAVSKLISIKSGLLLMDVGLGKTLAALAGAEHLLKTGEADRVVIVSPKRPQTTVWKALLEEYYHKEALVVNGTPSKRAETYAKFGMAGSTPYLITRFDQWLLPSATKEVCNDCGKSMVLRKNGTWLHRKRSLCISHGHHSMKSELSEGDRGFDWQYLSKFLTPRTVFIVDECHKLKHHNIQRYRGMAQALLKGRVMYRWLLTGTIVHDKPQDIYGPIRLLGWRVWNNAEEFRNTYFGTERVRTNRHDRFGKTQYATKVGVLLPERAKDLRSILKSLAYEKRAEELGNELPAISRFHRTVVPTILEDQAYGVIKGEIIKLASEAEKADQALQYAKRKLEENKSGIKDDTLKVEAEAALKKVHESLLATIAMERMFSCDPHLVSSSPSDSAHALKKAIGHSNLEKMSPGSKARELLSWLDDFLGESVTGKVIIFSSFRKTVELFKMFIDNPPAGLDEDEKEALEVLKDRTLYFHGGLSQKEADETVARFRTDPTARVLFSSDAGGESQNFQAASFVVHYDLPFVLSAVEQREGRVRRLGQKASKVFAMELRFAPQEAFSKEMEKLASRFVDPRLRALFESKLSQKNTLLGSEPLR